MRMRTITLDWLTPAKLAEMTGADRCRECWANETAEAYTEPLPHPDHNHQDAS